MIPKRGLSSEDKNNKLKDFLPAMGYHQVDTIKSEQNNGSRTNIKEADEIVAWIKDNFKELCIKYDVEYKDANGLIGVITPFKAQSNLIQSRLISAFGEDIKNLITVGTVHAFQGSERKIIIFSTVYGREDGCPFIDRSPSLLNVAVSRAKDSFLVFGDVQCLSDRFGTPSNLLRSMLANEI